MGLTKFPYGVDVGNSTYDGGTPFQIRGVSVTATAAEINALAGGGLSAAEVGYLNGAAGSVLAYSSGGKKMVAGTVIVPAAGSTAFVPTGLTSADFAVACAWQPLETTAGTVGGFVSVASSVSGGTVTIQSYDQMGTAATTAGTAVYFAVGS